MELLVHRLWDNKKATIGALYIDKIFECFTLEDEKRDKKVMAETRIPEGTYEIKFRTEGGHHDKYSKDPKFKAFHKGMLELQNVPNFQYILIHIGNYEKDTAGCLLVGNTANSNMTLADSTGAYINLYKKVSTELVKGNKVTITYKDIQP